MGGHLGTARDTGTSPVLQSVVWEHRLLTVW